MFIALCLGFSIAACFRGDVSPAIMLPVVATLQALRSL